MQISTKFTIAVHLLTAVAYFSESQKVTSDFLAGSIGSNPVIIRNIMGQLKEAGLIDIKRGPGGVTLEKKLTDISFLDIYKAVETNSEEVLFVSMRIQILSVQSAERFTRALMGHWKRFRRTLK